MIAFAKRRYIGVLSVLAFTIIITVITCNMFENIINTSLLTGSLLLLMVVFLLLFNIRKRFSFLPLGRASTWLQVHLYVAWAAIITYFIHTGGRIPNGGLEGTVGWLFIIVALSGIVGLVFTRALPAKLTEYGGNVPFDKILSLKRKLKVSAEKMIIDSIELTKKSTISDFYADQVEYFFIGSRMTIIYHLIGSKKHLKPIFTRISALKRYLNDEEVEIIGRLKEMIIEKDNLDYQFSMQRVLKIWLFTHIPLSYSLLLFGVVHGLLAWSFVGN